MTFTRFRPLHYVGLGIFLVILWGLNDPLSLTPLAILLCGLCAGILFISMRHPQDFDFLFKVFAFAILLRFFVVYLFYRLSFMPGHPYEGFFLLNDGYTYSENGWKIHFYLRLGIPFDPVMFIQHGSHSRTVSNFDFWNAAVYSVFGKQPMVLFSINALAGVLPILFLYELAKDLFSLRAARRSAILFAFWPSLAFWSTQNLKEPLIVCTVVLVVWSVMMLTRNASFFYVCTAGLALWALFRLSPFHIFVVLGVVSLPLSLLFGSRAWLSLSRDTRIAMAVSLIVTVILLIPTLVSYIPKFWLNTGNFNLLEWINYMRNARVHQAESAYLTDFEITTVPKLLCYLPLGLLYAFLAPFPWHLGSFQEAFGAGEMLFFYFLLPHFFRGARYFLKAHFRETAILFFYVPLMLIILCLIEGNIGTLFRHRASVMPFMLLAIAVGWIQKEQQSLPLKTGSYGTKN